MTINDVIENNRKAKQFWFSPKTMNYFNSVIETNLFNDLYFVTSEMRDDAKILGGPNVYGQDRSDRKYTIRLVVNKGEDIVTVGKFMEYNTLKEAIQVINSLLHDMKNKT